MKFAPSEVLTVAIGGFVGSIARYQINELIPSLAGTFLVNVLGCVGIGILMYESIFFGAFSRRTRLFFGVGCIGSFTTFSAFAAQSFDAGPILGCINIAANIFFGLCGVLLGRFLILNQRRSLWNT